MCWGVHGPTNGGARSACETGGRPPISALTNAFSISLDRGRTTDDFGPRIIGRRTGIEEESAHLRQDVKQIRHVIERMRTGIAICSSLFRTFLDQGSATMTRIRRARTQASNRRRTWFDDLSVEVIARSDPCTH
jgi:hypothetical protein